MYSIERKDMKLCMIYKCIHFCYGVCKISKCTLRKTKVKIIRII